MASIDVFIPCYNYGRFLRQSVDSVRTQGIRELRILIIDDASTDDSLTVARELAQADPRIHVIGHPQNLGHIATYNEGIDWVEADYMLLLSADDLIAPGALRRAIDLMEAHPRMAFVHGRHVEFKEAAGAIIPLRCVRGHYVRLKEAAGPEEGSKAGATVLSGLDFIRQCCADVYNPVGTVTAVVRGRLQKQVGGYRPSLPHSGDFEMWLRLAAHGDVGMVHAVQGYTRIHESNMRHQYISGEHMVRDYRQRLAAFEAFFAEAKGLVPELPALAALARRRLAEEVFWDASRRFEAAGTDSVDELLALALAIDPAIARSPAWAKLRVKRVLGVRLSRFLLSLLERCRQRPPLLVGQKP